MKDEEGNNPKVTTEEVLALLDKQVELFRRLLTLAGKQREQIGQDDTKPLLRLLAQRQTLTEELTRLGSSLRPVCHDWHKFRERLEVSDAHRAKELLGQAKAMLRKLMESDAQDARLLSVRKVKSAEAISASVSSQMAVAAYNKSSKRCSIG